MDASFLHGPFTQLAGQHSLPTGEQRYDREDERGSILYNPYLREFRARAYVGRCDRQSPAFSTLAAAEAWLTQALRG
jgi:hypothetical protein